VRRNRLAADGDQLPASPAAESRQDSTSRSFQVVDFALDLRDPDQLEVLLGFQVFNFGSRLLDCGSEVVVRGLNRG